MVRVEAEELLSRAREHVLAHRVHPRTPPRAIPEHAEVRGRDRREEGGAVASEESWASVELSNECARNKAAERVSRLVLATTITTQVADTHHTQVDDPLAVAFEPADLCVELRSVTKTK